MSLMFQFLTVLIAIVIESLFFIVVGIPMCVLCLWFIDKYSKFSISKKIRIWWSIGLNISLAFLLGAYIYIDYKREPYRDDWALDFVQHECQIALPEYSVLDVTYPAEWNRADDFGVDKRLSFQRPLSNSEINQLEDLCTNDSRWDKLDSSTYVFERRPDFDELIVKVIIYCDSNIVYTEYHRF